MAVDRQSRLAYERAATKKRALDELTELVDLAEAVRRDIENEDDNPRGARWWADHTQGLAYQGTKVERLLNQMITWDEAIRLTNVS